MSISVRFLLDLHALKDRGLNPTFEDVVEGIEAARSPNGGRSIHHEHVEEGMAIQRIQDSCRKRQAGEQKLEEMIKSINDGGKTAAQFPR